MSEITNSNGSLKKLNENLPESMEPLDDHKPIMHSMNIVEIFKLEDYDKLEAGLDHLYSTISNTSNAKSLFPTIAARKDEYKDFITKCRNSYVAGSWITLYGFASRTLAEVNFSVRCQYPIIGLPSNVELVLLTLYHLMPSMIMVTAQFDFTDSTSSTLNDILMEEQGEGSVIFGGREGHIPPEQVKAEKVSKFLLDLQNTLEEFMAFHLTGVFLAGERSSMCKYRCPSTILYSLKNIPFTSKGELSSWISHQRRFINILGYSNITPTIYQHDNKYLLLTRPDYHNENRPPRMAILASRDRFIGNETWMRLILDDRLIALQAIDYIMEIYSRKIIHHRNSISNHAIGVSSNFWNLRKSFISCYAQKSNVDSDYFDFRKIDRELTSIIENERWLKYNVHEFHSVDELKEQPDFGDQLVEHIRSDGACIDAEFSLHKERLSDLSTSINTISNFINSQWMFWLTLALVFLTVILAIVGFWSCK